ncbi:MAG: NADH-quinone oxidoreductase subunit NuoN [Alphaproteobacteria bacterium]|nr:NADH-quinone oxidoreductase subunit NuoN [Alphaproteobacteria bacterium]|tara:strand:- start:550 stop:1995 length:1446 start_codon:yes stop_codon:yes gene_type:complete
MNIAADISVIWPELFVAVAAMVMLMYGAFRGEDSGRTVTWVGVLVLVVAGLLVLAGPNGPVAAFNGQFMVDAFAVFTKVLLIAGAALALILAQPYNMREDIHQFEFPILMVFAVLGMMMMVSANDLIAVYVGLELQSLSLYVIAAIRRDNLRSSEAGLKYFVLGALSSGILLYGMSLVYGFAGTTSFEGLAATFAADSDTPIGVIVGLVFIAAGLAFKVSAVPFHMWTPDVYEGAPTPVTAFFAAAPKIAAMALFVRVMLEPFGDLLFEWQQIIWFISLASMILGSFAAIVQTNIKRLMAYSSIGHMGFVLVGLAAGNEQGVQGILLYLTIYLFMNMGTFACILAMRRQGRMVEEIDELAGLSKTNPYMAAAIGIFMFSMAGIPPLAGFFAKFYIFLAAINAELYFLTVAGLLTSVVGSFYYLRIVKLMYFDEPADAFDKPIGREISIIVTVTGVVTVFFFIGLAPVLSGAEAAAAVLFGA